MRNTRMKAAVVAALCMCALPGAAQDPYRLGVGDRLSFAIIGAPELGRELTIGLDGSVFLPLIGPVDADGRTLTELRDTVLDILRRSPPRLAGETGFRALDLDAVFIDIAEYRPVYVSGVVAAPGQVAFRPGMTIRQAIVNAGGIDRIEEGDDYRLFDLALKRGRLRDQIVASEERLRRMRTDLELVSAGTQEEQDGPVPDGPGGPAVAALRAVNDDWVGARTAERDTLDIGREAEIRTLEARLDALRRLRGVNEETQLIEQENFDRVRALQDRGMTTANTLNDVRRDLLQASSRLLETDDEILRLEVALGRVRNDAGAETAAEVVTLLAEIEAEASKLMEMRNEYASLSTYLGTIGASPGEVEQEGALIVRVFRAGAAPDILGFDQTERAVQPGDVLEVVYRQGGPGGG